MSDFPDLGPYLLLVSSVLLAIWAIGQLTGRRRPGEKFNYRSDAWRALCRQSIAENIAWYGRRTCERCLGHADTWWKTNRRVKFHTDHARPVAVDWGRRLCRRNTQQLCERCNTGKGARSTVHWKRINRLWLPVRWPVRVAILAWQRRVWGWKF